MLKLKDFRGTVSHGTMRNEDLIPTFANTLSKLIFTVRYENTVNNRLHKEDMEASEKMLRDIKRRMAMETYNYYTTEDTFDDLEWLFNELDNYAPPGYHFGAHEGDGSDYGFWENESIDSED